MDIKDYTELKELGLSTSEIKVYITLLKLNEAKTGRLCNYSQIPSSKIYIILDSLIKKGLVSYKLENKIKVYMASPPDILESILIEKQKKITALVDQLRKEKLQPPNFSYKTYNNLKGIKSMWCEMQIAMNKTKQLDSYLFKDKNYERLEGFFNRHMDLRYAKNIKANLIIPDNPNTKDFMKKYNLEKNKYTDIRYTKSNGLAEWGLVGNEIFYIYYTKDNNHKGILISDPVIASTFKEVFNKIWDTSKKQI